MGTWVDQEEATSPARITAALELVREHMATGDPSCACRYAGADERFALWLHVCDRWCFRRAGVSIFDLADWLWRDAFDSGQRPRDAVMGALQADDIFAEIFAGLD